MLQFIVLIEKRTDRRFECEGEFVFSYKHIVRPCTHTSLFAPAVDTPFKCFHRRSELLFFLVEHLFYD